MQPESSLTLTAAREEEVGLVLAFIRELADYERLLHEVVADEDTLRRTLFGTPRRAEVVFARLGGEAVGFALFFHNFSTFLGKPGIYLEDLFVQPAARGRGIGRALLAHLAKLAIDRGCERLEWNVLDWNEPSIGFYRSLGARSMNGWNLFRLTGAELQELAAGAPSAGSAATPRAPARLFDVVPRLPVADLERTVAFYRELVGLEAGTPSPAAAPAFVILARDGHTVQFYVPDPPGSEPIGHATLSFVVDDARALHRSLATGLTVEWGPEVYGYGRRELAVRDPDGYLVILSEETGDPPTRVEV